MQGISDLDQFQELRVTSDTGVTRTKSKKGGNNINIIKLFIGQIPRHMDAEQVMMLFAECGVVVDATIILNHLNEHQGCAFVYMEYTEALIAINRFHNKKRLDPVRSDLFFIGVPANINS
jgi:RNA recognition motif-containing protein